MCSRVHMPQHTCGGGQETTCESQFSPSLVWVPGIGLRVSSFATNTSTCWNISLAPHPKILRSKYEGWGGICIVKQLLSLPKPLLPKFETKQNPKSYIYFVIFPTDSFDCLNGDGIAQSLSLVLGFTQKSKDLIANTSTVPQASIAWVSLACHYMCGV